MSDVPFCSSENACTEGGEQTNGCEPVCINVSRIYDSCGAKDCLSNLPVMFTEANQKIIDGACSVKISNVRIITSTVEVEPVAFHRGFYSVDMMYSILPLPLKPIQPQVRFPKLSQVLQCTAKELCFTAVKAA